MNYWNGGTPPENADLNKYETIVLGFDTMTSNENGTIGANIVHPREPVLSNLNIELHNIKIMSGSHLINLDDFTVSCVPNSNMYISCMLMNTLYPMDDNSISNNYYARNIKYIAVSSKIWNDVDEIVKIPHIYNGGEYNFSEVCVNVGDRIKLPLAAKTNASYPDDFFFPKLCAVASNTQGSTTCQNQMTFTFKIQTRF